MKRYAPFKFEEAIDSIQDFDNLIEDLFGRVIKIIKGVE